MVDAVLSLPPMGTSDDLYVFSGTQYAKISFSNDKVHGSVHWIKTYWPKITGAGFRGVDAITPVPGTTDEFYLFYGGQYFRATIDSNGHVEYKYGAPRSIKSNWKAMVDVGFHSVDAAFHHPDNDNYIYFFFGTQYLQYNLSKDEVNYGPHSITERFSAIAKAGFDRVDAIVQKPGEKNIFYVFRGDQYFRMHFNKDDSSGSTVSRDTHLIADQWNSLKSWV